MAIIFILLWVALRPHIGLSHLNTVDDIEIFMTSLQILYLRFRISPFPSFQLINIIYLNFEE